MPTWGKRSRTTVDPSAWIKSIGKLTSQGVERDEIVAAFKLFASDIEANRVSVTGKDAFWVFMSRWHKYTASHAVVSAEDPEIENTWT